MSLPKQQAEQDKQKLFTEFEKLSKKFWAPGVTILVKNIVTFLNPLAKKDDVAKTEVRYKEIYLEVSRLGKSGDPQAKYLLAKDSERSEHYLNKSSDQWAEDAKANVLRKDSAAAGYAPAMLDLALMDVQNVKDAVFAALKDKKNKEPSPAVQRNAEEKLSTLAEQFIKIMALPANPINDPVKKKAEKVMRSFPALRLAIEKRQKEPSPLQETKIKLG